MPELPEVETIARGLDGPLRGLTIAAVEVLRGDILRDYAKGGRALRGAARTKYARAFEQALIGARVVDVSRRAKIALINFADGRRLAISPRFTGSLEIDQPDDRYTCVKFRLSHERRKGSAARSDLSPPTSHLQLQFRDIRRLGTLTLLTAEQFDEWSAAIGPEPLDSALTAERFSGILRSSSRAIKTVLMDQRKLAGVGNIYANEALWRARLSPKRASDRMTAKEAATLLGHVQTVLSESIAAQGTTFRDFRGVYGDGGEFGARLAVYGRGGEPCQRCGTTLRETHAIEGRTTVWCAQCQK